MSEIMTDRDLLEALDLEHPGLGAVRAAVTADDLEAAREQLTEYLRTRESEVDTDPPGPDDRPRATTERGDELCQLLASRDWLSVANPEDTPERLYSTQIMVQNDHGELSELALAYAETGNHRYARECVSRMLEWVDDTGPLPTGPPIGPTAPMWRTIEYVNPRIANWSKCLALLVHCPAVSVEEQMTILKVILHHLRYVANNQVPGMPNMVIHLFEKLIGHGRRWPEFSDSAAWVETGVDGLYTLLDDYFYPDGAYIELSYFAHECFTRTAQMGERGEIELPPGFGERLARIFDFPAYMVKPNGSYPSVNDIYTAQDPDEIPDRRVGLVELGVEVTGREDLRYIHSFGKEGKAPELTSRAFPHAGFYVMRSDWTADARYMVFDGGQSAGGHNHVDKLNFELYAYGNTLVTDSGCAGPWSSPWRSDYFVGTAGHNTIMVDGRGQVAGFPLFDIPSVHGRTSWRDIAPEPLPNRWVSGNGFDYAGSRYRDGYADYGSEQSRRRGFAYERRRVDGVERMQPWTQEQEGGLRVPPNQRVFADHERKVFFAKPDYWILSDRLLGGGSHLAESLFHFQASASAEIDEGDHSVRTVNGAAGLSILPSSESRPQVRIVCGQEQPLQGWVPAGWGHHRPSPVAIFAFEAELPLAVDTVLYPYPKDEAPALSVERLEVQENGKPVPAWVSSGLCLCIDDRRDYYLAAHEHRAVRMCGPLVSDAEIVLLRCDGAGEPDQLSLVNGSFVELAGRTIVVAEETFRSLEVSWSADGVEIQAKPPVGASVWAGDAGRLIVNGAASLEIRPVDGQVAVFENWLD